MSQKAMNAPPYIKKEPKQLRTPKTPTTESLLIPCGWLSLMQRWLS